MFQPATTGEASERPTDPAPLGWEVVEPLAALDVESEPSPSSNGASLDARSGWEPVEPLAVVARVVDEIEAVTASVVDDVPAVGDAADVAVEVAVSHAVAVALDDALPETIASLPQPAEVIGVIARNEDGLAATELVEPEPVLVPVGAVPVLAEVERPSPSTRLRSALLLATLVTAAAITLATAIVVAVAIVGIALRAVAG